MGESIFFINFFEELNIFHFGEVPTFFFCGEFAGSNIVFKGVKKDIFHTSGLDSPKKTKNYAVFDTI